MYLYEHTDYVALPYRKTSQSGILEMAFYFRKPILASDVPYFRRMLTEFPSFGILSGKMSRHMPKRSLRLSGCILLRLILQTKIIFGIPTA